jgi:hypothetical protein
MDEGDEAERYNYTEDGRMVSVDTFGDPPATEFEDSTMWELARNEVLFGNNIRENGENSLYKGQIFLT